MSTKHVRTTGDLLRFGCSLKIECCFCGHLHVLSPRAAVKALGNAPLRGVSRRFRCLSCGFKQARIQFLSPP